MNELANQVAVVTGAGRGIGVAIVNAKRDMRRGEGECQCAPEAATGAGDDNMARARLVGAAGHAAGVAGAVCAPWARATVKPKSASNCRSCSTARPAVVRYVPIMMLLAPA